MRAALWVFFLAFIACYICGPVIDPDLWWHITAGRWMWAHGEVPQVDHWNMFGAGKPWRAYSWSNELLFALVDRSFGDRGLWLLQLCFAQLIVLSFGYCYAQLSRNWFLGALLGAYVALACYNNFTLRPQSLVWVFFIWTLYLGHTIARDGLDLRKGAALLLIFALWANSHITTIFGLAALGAMTFDRKRLLLTIRPLAIAFLGTLCTPYFGGEWLTFFSKTGHPLALTSISEFQPATIMQYPTSFLVILVVAFIVLVMQSRQIPSGARIAGLCGFVLAGLAVVKFLPMAAIYAGALIALQWETAARAEPKPELVEGIDRLWSKVDWIPREGLTFVFICLGVVYCYKPWKVPVNRVLVPVAAVDFIQQQQLPHPILHDFGRGGYVMYRFSDADGNLEHKVPIDGRTNVMTREVWEAHQAALFGQHNWRDYFNLVNPQTVLWRSESALTSILLYGTEWCRVFTSGKPDEGYSVFVTAETQSSRGLQAENCRDPAARIFR